MTPRMVGSLIALLSAELAAFGEIHEPDIVLLKDKVVARSEVAI